jgi:Ni,Fe-hydrogenase I cytochrome b subunit
LNPSSYSDLLFKKLGNALFKIRIKNDESKISVSSVDKEKEFQKHKSHLFLWIFALSNASLTFVNMYSAALFSANYSFYPFTYSFEIYVRAVSFSLGMTLLQILYLELALMISNKQYKGQRTEIILVKEGSRIFSNNKNVVSLLFSFTCLSTCGIFIFIEHSNTIFEFINEIH